ncbi:HNH endonuclease [Candidatus Woesearchaeota archaeon]|nr:HNH endonuclease [Candidatus Woesearchaeota archaeon]
MANTYVDGRGYRRFSDSGTLVSRWVAEKKLGRELDDEEIVHHKDRNKLNNRTSNLWVCRDQDEHESYHEEDGDFD